MLTDRKQLKKKICMLGAFGAGKTSLVRHFVHSIFDETYLSTIGVKIDRKVVELDEVEVTLILWDIAGEEEFFQIPPNYVGGADGYLLVVDGTRPETFATAFSVKERMDNQLGELPSLILLNKADLVDDWKLTDAEIESMESSGLTWLRTSAKTGENVEKAFLDLAARVV